MIELTRRQVLGHGIALAGASLLVPTASAQGTTSAPVVATRYGQVRGFTDNGVNVFRGIRYGADTSSRRFMPPLAPTPWDGVVDALEYGASAPQNRTSDFISEDCLFLNVWTPGPLDGHKRPVMFYIHGGAYSHGSGSSPLYDGKVLAKNHDCVVVTVNHRLNALGYLFLQQLGDADFADSGNCGQLDLILALRWVRENIANFGGDPDRVLAFGQSGGGAKIATMMAMPAAEGLFHRAASMSGQQVTASGPGNATARTQAFLDEIGIAASEVHKLSKLPLDQLLNGLAARDPVLADKGIYFGPVLDMRSLNRHPFYPDAAPQSAHIPMILGNTHDETRLFYRDPSYYNLKWNDLPDLLLRNIPVDIDPNYVLAEYRDLYPEYSPSEIFFKATTAGRSWRAAIEEAQERAKLGRNNTFVYQLDFQSPERPEWGAPHTFDIPLVFGNLGAAGSITGTGPDAKAVSAMMAEAFASFARTGKPASKNLPAWHPYTLPNRETMIIDAKPEMRNDPRGAERKLFARVPYVQPGT